ncbi:MAG TPA: HBL/NHE enterotoxin family protein [Candidatus Sulfotelmatobacter sp.]|nr:HBL/NHE enterotoxin family protein [Candidatus Sulfotelmatobacter sp.]
MTGTAAGLAPPAQDVHKDVLAEHLNGVVHIRGYVSALAITTIPSLNPQPAWYQNFSLNLFNAKQHGSVWTTTLESAITSTVPQLIIDFGTKFGVAADDITQTISAANGNPDAAAQQKIQARLTWLGGQLADTKSQITDLCSQFTAFHDAAISDLSALTGEDGIQQALLADQALAAKLKADIDADNAEIAADEAKLTASGIAGGVGIGVGVAAMAFGPVGFLVGAFITVASIAEMEAMYATYTRKIQDAHAEIARDTNELDDDMQQIAALSVLNASVGKLADLNKGMGQSLSDIADWWGTVAAKTNATIADLASASTEAGFWLGVGNDVTSAREDWDGLVQFATNMQTIADNAVVRMVRVAADGTASASSA